MVVYLFRLNRLTPPLDPLLSPHYNICMRELYDTLTVTKEQEPSRVGHILRRLATGALALVAALAVTETTTDTPRRLPSDTRIVAMGDSFTSGHNNGDVSNRYENCFRDPVSYADQAARLLGVENYVNVACSGATPEEIITGRFDEPSQLQALDEQTEYIFITLGGNAVNLSELFVYCQRHACTTNSDPIATIYKRITSEEYQSTIQSTLTAITERAPNADILVVPYPTIIDRSAWCGTLVDSEIDAFVEQYIVGINTSLNAVVGRMGSSVHLVNIEQETDLCRNLGSTFFTNQDNPRSLGHPTKTTHQILAAAVLDVLTPIAYTNEYEKKKMS